MTAQKGDVMNPASYCKKTRTILCYAKAIQKRLQFAKLFDYILQELASQFTILQI